MAIRDGLSIFIGTLRRAIKVYTCRRFERQRPVYSFEKNLCELNKAYD